MHSAKRYLVIALSFAICMTVFAAFAPRIAHAITATLVQVVNTGNNPVPISAATHVGQASSNLVELVISQSPGSNQQVFRFLPDASEDGPPWIVPNGQTLIITDWSWYAFNLPANTECFVALGPGINDSQDVVHMTTDANGRTWGRVPQITAALGGGLTLKLNTCYPALIGISVYVHGYLTSQ
jgi:hypothetical protein